MYTVTKSAVLLHGFNHDDKGITSYPREIGMVTYRRRQCGYALKSRPVIKAKSGESEYDFDPAWFLLKPLLRRVDEETETLRSILSTRAEHFKSFDINDEEQLDIIQQTLDLEMSTVRSLMLLRITLGWLEMALWLPPSQEELDSDLQGLKEHVSSVLERRIGGDNFLEGLDESVTLDKVWSMFDKKMKRLKAVVSTRYDFEKTFEISSPNDLYILWIILKHEKAALLVFKEAKFPLQDLKKKLVLPSLLRAQAEFNVCSKRLQHLREVKNEIENLPHKSEVLNSFLEDYPNLEEQAIKSFEDSKTLLEKVKKMEDANSNKLKKNDEEGENLGI